LGGKQYILVGNLIEQQFLTVYDWSFGSALSCVLMFVILVMMLIFQKVDPEKEAAL